MPSPQFWQETSRRWLLPVALVLLYAAGPATLCADELTPAQQQLINAYRDAVDSEDLARIREYIVNNPARWAEDENNPVRGLH